jgi:nitrite reductase/ring-hydroxylating ferredoxin subunit
MSVDVGALDDFAERTVRVVRAEGREIGVIRWGGRLYAIGNVCVHQNGPVCHGILSARLTATAPGGMELDEAVPVIACPWHGWEYDVRTGAAIWDPHYRLRTYPVSVADGRVLIEVSRAPGSAAE